MSALERIIRIVVLLLSIFAMIYITRWYSRIGVVLAIFEVLLLIVAAYAVSPLLAGGVGGKAGQIFSGSNKHEEVPMLSEAEAAFKRQEYERGVNLLEGIADKYPTHLPIYTLLFPVLFSKLKDGERAREIYRKGWMAMSGDDRKRLEHIYKEYSAKEKDS